MVAPLKKRALAASPLWKKWEHVFLIFFLVTKVWQFARQWNFAVGFDAGHHLEMLTAITWSHPTCNIHTLFYCYHPPLSFLVARTLSLIGYTPVESVQLLSFFASLAAFWFLRLTVEYLGLLDCPEGMGFLYLTSSLPIQVYLGHSINMDVYILMIASAALYCAVRFVQLGSKAKNWHAYLWAGCLGGVLCLGLFLKFTAVLVLPLPLIVAVFLAPRKKRLRVSAMLMAAVVAVVVVALPYYFTRYYLQEGHWIMSNTDIFDAQPQHDARAQRSKDPVGFLEQLFSGSTAHRKGLEYRDLATLRLTDTWKDVWMSDVWLGAPLAEPTAIGTWYAYHLPGLLFIGLCIFLFSLRKSTAWVALGKIVHVFGLLLLAFLILYMYRNPWAGSLSNKAIYIAPASWTIGYLLAELLYMPSQLFRGARQKILLGHIFLCCCLLFVGINHLLSVY